MVLEQVCPQPRSEDELHDLLLSLVAARPHEDWAGWFAALVADGRAALVDGCWVATERRDAAASLGTDDDAAAACVGGHLQVAGPVTVEQLVADAPLPAGAPMGAPLGLARARTALARLEAKGSAIELPDGRWCARHLLVRLHGASRSRRRGMVEAVPIADYVRFLTDWQHVTPDTRLEGRAGLLEVIEQLAGIEVPAAEWESQILSARVRDYEPRWLDELCLSGEIVWARLTPRPERPGRSGTPSPATPLAFVRRDDLETMLRAVRSGTPAPEPELGAGAEVLAALRSRGACFRPELAPVTGRLPAEVDEGLWDLVARGLVTADAFSAVRSLLSARDRWRTRTVRRPSNRLARRRAPAGSGIGEGRWSLLPGPEVLGSPGGRRRGARPRQRGTGRSGGPSAPRPLGDRGLGDLGARVLQGALARGRLGSAADGGARRRPGRALRGRARRRAVRVARGFRADPAVQRRGRDGEQVTVAGADPLNMTGTIVGGTRVPTRRHQQVVYRDGVVVERLEAG